MLYSKLRKVSFRVLASVIISSLMVNAFTSFLPSTRSSSIHAASQTSKATDTKTYHIVAIGDSVTAGYEHGFTEHAVPYGFVEHVYEQALFHGLRSDYLNYGLLGLRTAGLKRWMDAVVNGVTVKSSDIQSSLPDPRADRIFAESKLLRSALGNADLILMTIGGNDMYAVLEKLEEGAGQAEATAVLNKALDIYETELEASLRLILSLQPKAKIVVADQYLPIPKPVRIGAFVFPLYPEADRLFLEESVKKQRERLNEIVGRLTKEGEQVKIANAASAFIDNELAYTSIADGDIHPSKAGYAAMGKAFAKAIWGDYRAVKPKEDGELVSIVLNGKEMISTNKPLLVQNRTYVPLRSIAEAMGATILWNAASRTATVKLENSTVDITVGSDIVRVNGDPKPLLAPPAFVHTAGKARILYVPLSALSEGLQFQVVFRETLKTVFINK
ncbi:stalk domain-containing protein [Paenibacillus sp. LHD-38]|uniref:stalk domain-containing protein n=1 Tax=Paenibacillus sp. LHD-38 TaxID=3072143 RepID=UPI00280FC501|nr:stalk domain-containing protein [Paenibacillus sp. LHD-38]MDQ8733021.1 stalk domain-containing protein [Paenibacillus sp. LHD-38]